MWRSWSMSSASFFAIGLNREPATRGSISSIPGECFGDFPLVDTGGRKSSLLPVGCVCHCLVDGEAG
jgi:hypothetical protein